MMQPGCMKHGGKSRAELQLKHFTKKLMVPSLYSTSLTILCTGQNAAHISSNKYLRKYRGFSCEVRSIIQLLLALIVLNVRI